MRKVFFRDVRNKKIAVNLIRYFKYKSDYYLVYTLGETDEKNFMKLYVVKIMEELGVPVSKYMSDDVEWAEMQKIIKNMIKEKKNNLSSSYEDVSISGIEGMTIIEARSFKLLTTLVELITYNDPQVIKEKVELPINNLDGSNIVLDFPDKNNVDHIPGENFEEQNKTEDNEDMVSLDTNEIVENVTEKYVDDVGSELEQLKNDIDKIENRALSGELKNNLGKIENPQFSTISDDIDNLKISKDKSISNENDFDLSLFDIKPILNIVPIIKKEVQKESKFDSSFNSEEVQKAKNINDKLTQENILLNDKLKKLSEEIINLNKQVEDYKNKNKAIRDFIQRQMV